MKNKWIKGFTMVELLIVMAIVGILVAISIPIFSAQIEKAREAHDIATMRSAASAAIELYYAGITDATSAAAAGMSWDTGSGNEGTNAYGAYDPKTGKFYPTRASLPASSKKYGKGTKVDAGTVFTSGNPNGNAAYVPTLDYTDAVVMVSLYVLADSPHADVYWKENNHGNNSDKYIGGGSSNRPNYCMRIALN